MARLDSTLLDLVEKLADGEAAVRGNAASDLHYVLELALIDITFGQSKPVEEDVALLVAKRILNAYLHEPELEVRHGLLAALLYAVPFNQSLILDLTPISERTRRASGYELECLIEVLGASHHSSHEPVIRSFLGSSEPAIVKAAEEALIEISYKRSV